MNKNEKEELETTIVALYQHYLQGNSQIHNFNEWIVDQITETIETINELQIVSTFDIVEDVLAKINK